MNSRALILISSILCFSGLGMLVTGFASPGLSVLRLAAIPDLVACGVFAALAVRRI